MEPKKYEIEEYGLRFVKEAIIRYRRETENLGALTVTIPVEAETSLRYLQEHYAGITFAISVNLNFREILIEGAKVEATTPV